MGVVRSFQGVQGTIGQPTAQVIDGSLSFKPTGNQSGSERLNRTPGSSGNRRTWTWSAWVKRGNRYSGTNEQHLLDSRVNDDDRFYGIAFAGPQDNETLFVWEEYSAGNYYYHKATPSLRDNGWYHLVVTVDTTQPNGIDRVRFYANGKSLPVAAEDGTYGWYAEDFETNVNQASSTHFIGSFNGARNFDGYMSQNYLIDGLALGPSYFGFTDPLTGTWRPKKLKQGDPTVNDGTQWSSYLSNSTGASNLFDGDLTTFYGPDGNTQTWTPPNPIEVGSSVRVYFSSGVSSRDFEINDNGNVVATGTGTKWVDLNFTGSLRKISGTNGWNVSAIEIDGVVLVDSTTTTVDFGTNGFYLPMDNEDDFEKDKSGKGNDFTTTNFSGTSVNPDVVKDSPSGAVFGGRSQTGITTTSSAPANYATFNAIDNHGNTLSNANLTASNTAGSWYTSFGSIPSSDGRHYFEVTPTTLTTTCAIGVYVGNGRTDFNGNYPYDANTYMIHQNGSIYHAASTASYQSTYSANDTVGVAVDSKNRKVWISVNGSFVSGENPTTGVGGLQSVNGVGAMPDGEIYPVVSNRSAVADINFGQKPFKYAPPQGYSPLNSASARPNKVVPRPDQYVGVTTYSGDNAEYRRLSLDHQPDFTWFKERGNTRSHILSDTVTGITKHLSTDGTGAQTSPSYPYVSSVDERGIVLRGGTSSGGNVSGRYYVAWTWKAGGNKNTFNVDDVGYATAAAAGLDGGTITPVGASVGTKQGFSIVNFQGTGATASFSHGLEQAPDFMICKSDASGPDWGIYHRSMGSNKVLYFTTAAASTSTTAWNDTHPTDSLVHLGANGTTNQGGANQPMIYYIWHDVPGLQKFGTYEGTGNSDGPYIELGFKPAVVIYKNVDEIEGWGINDTTRSPDNPADEKLEPNTNSAEASVTNRIDLLSTGFKIRAGSAQAPNESGDTYIYAAWAEAPASNLFGGQSNAR